MERITPRCLRPCCEPNGKPDWPDQKNKHHWRAQKKPKKAASLKSIMKKAGSFERAKSGKKVRFNLPEKQEKAEPGTSNIGKAKILGERGTKLAAYQKLAEMLKRELTLDDLVGVPLKKKGKK